MNEQIRGTPLLSVVPAAYHLIIPLVCGPPMAIGGVGVVLGVPGHRVGGVLMVLFGAGLTWVRIRRISRRTVLIEVTERGIMIYAKPDAIDVSSSLLKDLFIPWERLEAMRFLGVEQIRAEELWMALGGIWVMIRPECIGLKLRTDWSWPPPGTLRQGLSMRRAKPGEIYLRTGECLPTGRKLWNELATLAKKHGGPDVVVSELTLRA